MPQDETPQDADLEHFKHIGTIQIIVVRCTDPPNSRVPGSPSTSFTDDTPHDIFTSESDTITEHVEDHGPERELVPPTSNIAATLPTMAEQPESQELELGGLGGLFDGPADSPPGAYSGFGSWTPPYHYRRNLGDRGRRYPGERTWREYDAPLPSPYHSRYPSNDYELGYARGRRTYDIDDAWGDLPLREYDR